MGRMTAGEQSVFPQGELPAVERLQGALKTEWSRIAGAKEAASKVSADLAGALEKGRLVPADTAVVGFGSLARQEWTRGSDFDWTLLVDGQVSAEHLEVARSIRKLAKVLGHPEPGPTGIFGGLAFSHDIVHQIGGESDTNKNTTRRILLLFESRNFGSGAPVRERVIRSVFRRYVGEDLRYRISEKPKSIPRFLLNDVVRYWRTMAVDFAGKRRERDEGWALRNVKLRMSRKLLFSAALWGCLSCQLDPSAALSASTTNPPEHDAELTKYLMGLSNKRPLDLLAEAFLKYGALDSARRAFEAYNEFLGLLDDLDTRKVLQKLELTTASDNETFRAAKDMASQFQRSLNELFFETDDSLKKAAQLYGVF
jgi:predicted nucleotidyltransferase